MTLADADAYRPVPCSCETETAYDGENGTPVDVVTVKRLFESKYDVVLPDVVPVIVTVEFCSASCGLIDTEKFDGGAGVGSTGGGAASVGDGDD